MTNEQSLIAAICECSDANEVAAILSDAQLERGVFRDLAAVLAADVAHLAPDLNAALAAELARFGCSPKVHRLLGESIAHSCQNAPTEAGRFACVAARISMFGKHEGPLLVAAVCAAAEAAMLSAGSRGSTQAVRLHQADVARAFLTPAAFGRRRGGQRAAA